MAAAHATGNHPRMLKENNIREETQLQHLCKARNVVWWNV